METLSLKTSMTASDRMKQRMSDLEIKAVDLVKMKIASKGAISKWMNDAAVPSGIYLVDLCKALECTPEWLLSGKDKKMNSFCDCNVTKMRNIKGYYPLISWVQAGAWTEINEVSLIDVVRYPCPVKCSESTFVLKVRGVSMEPKFREGDLIFVDPEIVASSGKYVVARLDDENEATFKQLIVEGSQKFLKPSNPNWPEQFIPINGNCTIVGVAVFVGRDL